LERFTVKNHRLKKSDKHGIGRELKGGKQQQSRNSAERNRSLAHGRAAKTSLGSVASIGSRARWLRCNA
jgi:hypothetical protein